MILTQPKNLAKDKSSLCWFSEAFQSIKDMASLASLKLGPIHFIEANLSFWQNYKPISENEWCR